MSKQAGSSAVFWVVGGIIVLMLAGIASTIWISESNGVSEGYVPLDQRAGAPGAPRD